MSTKSASVARQSLPSQLDRVEAGEEVSITRHGLSYGLRAPDAAHLATAVAAGADRFLTNNRKDFPKHIGEIDIVYPDELAQSHGR